MIFCSNFCQTQITPAGPTLSNSQDESQDESLGNNENERSTGLEQGARK